MRIVEDAGASGTARKQRLWGRSLRTHLVCTTCMAISMNGRRIAGIGTSQARPQVVQSGQVAIVHTTRRAAALGAAPRSTCVPLNAPGGQLRPGATTLGFVWPRVNNPLYFFLFLLLHWSIGTDFMLEFIK